ncbi:MAG: hypothetical protein M1814_003750 [Vezdaea aestivalis]|nr:MAG: hypothetical protein M1814_003750 [Vezdaea aestivalis]
MTFFAPTLRYQPLRPTAKYIHLPRSPIAPPSFLTQRLFGMEHSTQPSSSPSLSSSSSMDLKSTLRPIIASRRAELKAFKAAHSDTVIGEVKVENILGGMRGLKSLLWEGSSLSATSGIRFRGRTIQECQALLPGPPPAHRTSTSEMLPEAMFWLLITGKVPSEAQTRALSVDLAHRAQLPPYILSTLASFPKSMHPMTQFSALVAALSHESRFARSYAAGGLQKADYWEDTLEDTLDLLARLPLLAAHIYRRSYGVGARPEDIKTDPELDWAHNFAVMLGKGGKGQDDTDFQDLLRLYLALHGDHEGGNVSAHATHLVGSALSDVYLSYAAGLQGLAGPLHGLAAQEVVRFLTRMSSSLPTPPTPTSIKTYLETHLSKGQVIPGYGHAILRRPDPRFSALLAFTTPRPSLQSSPLIQLMHQTSSIAPEVLTAHGKTKNPFPNVDAASGVLFRHFGIDQELFYTVTFGVSRAIGALAQVVWDRALGNSIERPKSLDWEGLRKEVEGKGGEKVKAKL